MCVFLFDEKSSFCLHKRQPKQRGTASGKKSVKHFLVFYLKSEMEKSGHCKCAQCVLFFLLFLVTAFYVFVTSDSNNTQLKLQLILS